MKLSREAEQLLQQLWQCHARNPINHFEALPGDQGNGTILHPASRRTLLADPTVVAELVQSGLLRGRQSLSLTYAGLRYCQRRW